jgi:hypothetical protein
MRWMRAWALAAAALAIVAVVWMVAQRLGYPYDLEWLEGATLWHAQRVLDGQPLYVPPSLEFVPHPYTPLYPWLLALLGRAFGVSYVVGRALSTAAFAGALAVGWRFCRAAGASRALATAAMAIPCAAYVPTGAWIDLVRVDSLWLLLAAAGTTVAWRARSTASTTAPSGAKLYTVYSIQHAGRPIAAALLLVAAFFAKQTAAPLMVALALALLVVDRRAALSFVATLAVTGLPALWLMQRATAGWFWFYVYRVHHSHPFSASAASFVPGRLAMLFLPALPLAAWALARDRSPELRYAAWLACVGVCVSALAKGTWGAYTNALLPGVYFGALFIGVAASRLIATGDDRQAAIAWALVAATITTAPGLLPRVIQLVRPSTYHMHQANGYEPAFVLPATEEREATARLIARLRAVDGEVWLPSHAWYARLAGKTPLAGEMGADDLDFAGVTVAGFDEAVQTRRFAAVVVDEPMNARLQPLFGRATATRLLGPQRDDSNRHRPVWWLTPR